MNQLITSIVIRGLKGIAEIVKRSDIVLRTAIVNRALPMKLPPVLNGINKQYVRNYFQKNEHRERFADETRFPGFNRTLDIVNMTLEDAREGRLVQDESEYNLHVEILKQLIILNEPECKELDELVKFIEGDSVKMDLSALSSDKRQEVVLGFYMVDANRGGPEFVAAKIALIVADVLAEIGTEYVTFVIKDRELAKALESFLRALSEPDLEKLEEDEFLRHILKATLMTVSANADVITENELL